MAVVAAGALVLAGCTSTPDDTASDPSSAPAGSPTDDAMTSDDAGATSGGGATAAESTGKVDLGDVTPKDDTVSFSSGSEQYNAYNGNTAATNSTYNSVVNNQLFGGFWYWGTDGAIYPNEWFGSYKTTSEDPLTVEYTISDEAMWSDGTPITANDFLLEWASSNPESLGGADKLGFDPVSVDYGEFVPDGPQAEVDSKTFTLTYPEAYPDWELMVSGALPSHIAEKAAGLEKGALAKAILDKDTDTVAKVSKFWNTGWLFKNYKVEDESLVPSSGPYTLEGSTWKAGESLGLVPNEKF
ncbi:MAG: ABC transporter substrate-binding protein, partial [Ornithinimicrobium sp.]|uniref:ABC transporter substrate-binding protein n=1 Tax=Ornithinimicrobium sp. TaxID=1977084 RepID=UPI0026E0F502